MSLSQVKVKSLYDRKKKGAAALYRIKQNPHRLIITILIGNNLVNIGAASYATVVFTNLFGSSGIGIATGVMTFLVLVFGEITPKTYATQNPERVSLIVARPVELLSQFLGPIIMLFEYISRFMSNLLGVKEETEFSEEEFKTIVTMGAEKGILDQEEAEMMHNLLAFRGTKARDIMTPKAKIGMIDGNKRLQDVLQYIVKTPYSRYPVYEKNEDNITGVLDIDDVLEQAVEKNLDKKVKTADEKPYIIPESMEVDDLLTELESRKIDMAIVVDEYGEVSGVVTVEDILEEIVGDIFDRNSRESEYIKRVGASLVHVDARAPIKDVNKILHLDIKEGQFSTLAGYVQHKLQRMPKQGEKIQLKNVTLVVENVTAQKINSIKIVKN